MASHTPSQRYLSTRGGSYDFSFEEVVLKGLASDGGLFIPEEIPQLRLDPREDYTFEDLAFKIFSLYISPAEIPSDDLKSIIARSYSTFRDRSITPTVTLNESKQIHLLELFHGPTFAFKDLALQFLGNLFEYFLVRRNKDPPEGSKEREHLTVIGATSGDTGSAAIYGLRGKRDVSVFIMFPKGKVSPVQEAQMTTVTDANVHCLAVEGTFDDCQDFVKALFGDRQLNATHRLAAVNSINWARILAQITYYFYSYHTLLKTHPNMSPQDVRFVVPTGNFGNILAGYFAKRMGLPISKLVVTTNENDILHRFWQSGKYEKKPATTAPHQNGNYIHDLPVEEKHVDGVKETLSPAMDILVSSNFERLLWFLSYQVQDDGKSITDRRRIAGEHVKSWLNELKTKGGFAVDSAIIDAARKDFESERVSDKETVATIKEVYSWPKISSQPGHYILDPHSAIGVTASLRSHDRAKEALHVSLATAHPAKFSHAVELALKDDKGFDFKNVLPKEFVGIEQLPRRVTDVPKGEGLDKLRTLITKEVEEERNGHAKR